MLNNPQLSAVVNALATNPSLLNDVSKLLPSN